MKEDSYFLICPAAEGGYCVSVMSKEELLKCLSKYYFGDTRFVSKDEVNLEGVIFDRHNEKIIVIKGKLVEPKNKTVPVFEVE